MEPLLPFFRESEEGKVIMITDTDNIELSNQEIKRYSRHLIMPEVGMTGQRKLKAASVLLIGAGGLGSPPWHVPSNSWSKAYWEYLTGQL